MFASHFNFVFTFDCITFTVFAVIYHFVHPPIMKVFDYGLLLNPPYNTLLPIFSYLFTYSAFQYKPLHCISSHVRAVTSKRAKWERNTSFKTKLSRYENKIAFLIRIKLLTLVRKGAGNSNTEGA